MIYFFTMDYFNKYINFLNTLLINRDIIIPDVFVFPFFIILHFFILYSLYFISRRTKQRWRIKASYKYIKKIQKIKGDNEFARTIGYLRKIDPFIYEEMILSILKMQGYKIYRNKKYTGDGGIDGKFKFKGKLYYIQAKRYKSYIAKSHVDEFNKLINKNKVHGLFVHTGKTGKGSKEFKSDTLHFVSGNDMVLFLKNKKDISKIIK
jgi:restriction system protein